MTKQIHVQAPAAGSIPSVVSRELNRALIVLQTAANYGIKYVVTIPDGQSYSSPNTVAQVAKKPSKPRAHFKEMYISYVSQLSPGGVCVIPVTDSSADIERVRAAASAWCVQNWGNDAHTSCINRKMKVIEIMRTK